MPDAKQFLERVVRWAAACPEILAVDEDWGLVVSRRVLYSDGIEAEFGFTTVAWAGTPLDDGTVRVIRDGFKVLYDPIDVLANAVADAG